MRKVIAAFNMTLDGVCDHTTGIPSEDLHQHYLTYWIMQEWFCMDGQPTN
jgi:hypothetical protein